MKVIIYTFFFRLVSLKFLLYCVLNSNWRHSFNNLNAFSLHTFTRHNCAYTLYIYIFFFVTIAVVLSVQERDISLIKKNKILG